MEHWIEPQALGDYQRTGYNSPLLPGMAPPGVEHYKNRPGQLGNTVALPQLAPPGVEHYKNRPGQLSGIFDTVKSSLPTLLIGAVIGVVAWPMIQKQLKRI
jgi:hypothetical protein